jgi:opacity protein-like surface antigen
MPRGLAFVLSLFLLLGRAPSAAATDAQPNVPRLAYLDAPLPPLAELPPEPTREAEEFPRRTWEAFPSGGVATPFCRGSAFGLGHCGDTSSGPTLGVGVLYRVAPHVAFGLEASFARFASTAAGATETYSRSTSIGLLVRGYFLDHGMFDPYVETGFGQGSAVSGYVDAATGTRVRTEFGAPSFLTGAGIDFWLTPHLRVGPAFNYRFAWFSSVQGCAAATCTTYGVDDRGAVGSYASFSVRATIALGREM